VNRVLHLITNLKRGGAETQLAYLASSLAGAGLEVHVGFFDEGPNRRRMEERGVVLHPIRSGAVSEAEWESRGTRDPLAVWRIRRLIRRIDPQLVQTWIPAMDLVGGLAAILAGVPWILSERSDPSLFSSLPKIRARAFLARRAAAVVSNSAGGDRYWATRVGPRTLREVVRNGLPIEEIRATPPAELASLGAPADLPLVLYVGRLQAGKNVEALLAAFETVVRSHPSVCAMCGMGPLSGRVDEILEARSLRGRVFRIGFVPDVWSWLRRADVFVSVSNFEGMPNAVMEAMAAGVPLVLSDIPAHRDLVGDDAARFVAKENPEEIARGLLEALEDREGARERARRASARAEQWSVAAMAERYARVYGAVSARG
jgi:glycosyltransferase involved in cell wall biosynthesis